MSESSESEVKWKTVVINNFIAAYYKSIPNLVACKITTNNLMRCLNCAIDDKSIVDSIILTDTICW